MANIGNIFQNMNVTLESRGKFLNSIGGFENFQTFLYFEENFKCGGKQIMCRV